jgi:hypothetical protein
VHLDEPWQDHHESDDRKSNDLGQQHRKHPTSSTLVERKALTECINNSTLLTKSQYLEDTLQVQTLEV